MRTDAFVQLHATDPGDLPVILVVTIPPKERDLEADRRAEMDNLLATSGRRIVGEVSQHLAKPIGATCIGSGKIAELKALMAATGAKEAAFDCRLSPRQQRNLEEELEAGVVDYDELILDIFAKGARSHQAMLAVELARLEYLKARLRRLWSHLDRQRGGGGGGSSGFMTGTGEKQIESDRRLVRERIGHLRDQLERIEARTERVVGARDEAFKVALVGYTNAGKSTLMNALTAAGVLAEDRLFATLDTRTARLPLPGGGRGAVLSDTVGFIRNLPPELIASFHATLAEVREADLLLHVVDAASPVVDQQMSSVLTVLKQIGADQVPVVTVLNKADAHPSATALASMRKRHAPAVAVSARTGAGLDELRTLIAQAADAGRRKLTVRIPTADGASAAWIRAHAAVTAERWKTAHAELDIVCEPGIEAQLKARSGVTVLAQR